MTAVTDIRGARMFARYAYAPNHLGYCGPPDPRLLEGGRDEIEQAARQFTGAWPYLEVLSKLTGVADPLDLGLVESYWLGGGAGAELSPQLFTDELLGIIGPQARHYWAHLTEDLVNEATPNHCFHVFGVYPWSRLLGKGADGHPLHVLDSCRISWGTVLSTDEATAVVLSRQLSWERWELSLSPPETVRVETLAAARSGLEVAAGDLVAVHWGRVCDRLTPDQVTRLEESTERQLQVTNRRLSAS